MAMPDFSPDYCPDCGDKLDTIQMGGRERLWCSSCEQVEWLNPDIAAGFLVKKENELLLQKRKIEPHSGSWAIPAGYLELDEGPLEGAKRELKEETGLEVNGETSFVGHVSLQHPDESHVVVAVYFVDFDDVEGDLEPEEDEVEELEFWKFERVFNESQKLDYQVYLKLIEKIRN